MAGNVEHMRRARAIEYDVEHEIADAIDFDAAVGPVDEGLKVVCARCAPRRVDDGAQHGRWQTLRPTSKRWPKPAAVSRGAIVVVVVVKLAAAAGARGRWPTLHR